MGTERRPRICYKVSHDEQEVGCGLNFYGGRRTGPVGVPIFVVDIVDVFIEKNGFACSNHWLVPEKDTLGRRSEGLAVSEFHVLS